MKYSVFSLFRHALSGHKNWAPAWRDPEPKPAYDIIIVGGGGHGLSTAYYLAKEFGLKNIAVLEKGWLGSGNIGRNTTIIRSNYMLLGNNPFYELSMKLWEGLGYYRRARHLHAAAKALVANHNGDLPDDPEVWAALPGVGVMDMLRFQKFTIGWAWVSEYGSSDSAEHFPSLAAYSPLHNIKPDTKYPATLVTTADHDDRVVPGHSFKFAATLQAAQSGPAPVLIRIETSAGHGAGTPTAKLIEENADSYAFLVKTLGVKLPKGFAADVVKSGDAAGQ